MSVMRHILKKEFRQIIRDPAIMRLILLMPAIQLLVLPFAADYEIKNINIGIVDQDHSSYSRELIRKLEYSAYFSLEAYSHVEQEGFDWIEDESVDLFLQIPNNFESDLVREKEAQLTLAINAVNGTKGNLGALYAMNIIRDYNAGIRAAWIQWPRVNPIPLIEISHLKWYNKLSNYQTFMVPGILAILLTMVGSFLAAMNIVKEKEVGTIEQLNVTPIKKYHFILGKLIPFWLMSYVILTIGLIISYWIHGIVPGSNLGLLYLFSGVYVLAILGLGLLISNYTHTQQQAMMVSFFFMLVFILMSGLYTPIESMPTWAQKLSWSNPSTYMVDVMRMILLRGAQLSDIASHLIIVAGMGIGLNALAVWTYKKKN
jgi:ABC-2 type transport system permease protein